MIGFLLKQKHLVNKYMTKKILVLCALFAVLLAGGCFHKNKDNQPPPVNNGILESLKDQGSIKKFSSAAELKAFFENRQNFSGSPVPMGIGFGGQAEMSAKQAAPMGLGAGPAADSSTSAASDFSRTNNQVAGVEESDMIKTDGRYIYTVSNQDLSIVLATPAKDAAIVTSIKLPGRGQELYIKDNKLAVFGYEDSPIAADGREMIRPMANRVFLTVLDITDKKNPSVIKTWKFEGGYAASRMIGGRIYLVTTTYNFYPAGDFILPKIFENDQQISAEQTTDTYVYPDVFYVDGPFSYNATTVSLINLDDLDRALTSQVYLMPANQIMYASTGNLYLTYTKYISEYQLRMTISREMLFDRLSDKEKARINQISQIDSSILTDDEKAAKIDQVIQSYFTRLSDEELKNVLTELNDEFNRRYQAIYEELEKTVVHKIKLDGDTLSYQGAGEVSGHVINQFAMDEQNNTFRIATTRGQSWIMPFFAMSRVSIMPPEQTRESYNNLYVLDEQLKQIGSIERLAVGERIYAVRFMGNRAYVVTFKQTDPLFVIDLTTPANPKLAGQLKIPGFSSYLHPLSETMLIGIGKEAIDNGERGVDVKGLKMSLFDVADIATPKEVAVLSLGGRGSDTPVLYDHKAFLFSPDKKLLAIPVSLTKPDSTNYSLEFQGAVIINTDGNALKEVARIYHLPSAKAKAAGYGESINIQRLLYINNDLFSLSPVALQANDFATGAMIKAIELPLPTPIIDKPIPFSTPASGSAGSAEVVK